MKKFFIFCFMLFVMCINVNAQEKYDDSIYQLKQATSRKLTKAEYNNVKDFALKSGNTFHFEYEPTMYAKGVKNQRIGGEILVLSNATYLVANGITWLMTTFEGSRRYYNPDNNSYYRVSSGSLVEIEQAHNFTIISSCIVGVLDIVGACYIYIGHHQKNKSSIAVSPCGIKFTF